MKVATRTVGIVDDDAAIRDSLSVLLGARGVDVRCFASATEFLGSNDIDELGGLLVDHHMPGINGVELLELLKGRRVPIPVILMTGGSDPFLERRAKKAGALALLHKPVSGAELMKWIHAAFAENSSVPGASIQ